MIWANFLHIYQPPTQKEFWVKKIATESYRKLTKGLKENPKARLTLNINAVLTELLEKYNCRDVIADIKMLASRGQIELTASAKFHPFLPLMPEKEIIRQIELNSKTNKKFFGDAFNPKGFFPPEMAYNRRVGETVAKLGYQWTILDELAFSGSMNDIDWTQLYTLKGHNDFMVFFRERESSFRILAAQISMSTMMIQLLKNRIHSGEYLITAMDGETFGHHRPGLEDLLFGLYQSDELQSVTISELPDLFKKRQSVDPRPSSWALMKRDIEQNTPFSRWKDRHNTVHTLQWQLTNLALKTVADMKPTDKRFKYVRDHLDRALHSDQYWWASAMPWWSIEMIEAGAKDLKDTILISSAPKKSKELAVRLYRDIIFTAFDWQRSGKVDILSKSADEDVTQRITTDMPYIPVAEFNKMVGNLEQQMYEAAKDREYERAAQIRDRVNELNEKKDQITV
jgi:predicted glycosyl hydrolase (DUF1957 family)